jgi:protein involved in polysaccharide export with SLBB domain
MTLKDGIDLAGGFTAFGRSVQIQHFDASTATYEDPNRGYYRLRRGWQLTNNPALKAGDFIGTVRTEF